MKYAFFGLSILMILFCACGASPKYAIKGRYCLESDDYGKYILGYEVDSNKNFQVLVDVYVFAAGYSNKFIVAIQHPKTRDGMSADSNYYIIPFHEKFTYYAQDGILGPLTAKEYNQKKAQLGIGQITWLNVK